MCVCVCVCARVCVCVRVVCVTYHIASNQVGRIGPLAMIIRGVMDDLLPG